MRTADLPLPDAQRPHVSPMQFEKQWQYYAFAQKEPPHSLIVLCQVGVLPVIVSQHPAA